MYNFAQQKDLSRGKNDQKIEFYDVHALKIVDIGKSVGVDHLAPRTGSSSI